jgi:type II secretory pathway pseudopilin PulG
MRPRAFHRGFSMVEAVAAVGLVGASVLVVMTTASGAIARREQVQAYSAASLLVDEVLGEVGGLAYEDPTVATTVLGAESGETISSRSSADDVDDLAGWVETGLRTRTGVEVSRLTTWVRRVTVQWVSATDFVTVQGSESGVKRVTVSVERGGKTLASGSILRVKAWEAMTP